jgi:DNA-binding beta-propeller fold protein YncE
MRSTPLILTCLLIASAALAQDDIAALTERGKELYFERVSCWVCHGDNAEGNVGPTLQHGPTPMDIQEQLDSNPQMAVIVADLDPDADDLVALSTYLASLGGTTITAEQTADWRAQLAAMAAARAPEEVFYVSERDRKVMDIMSFDTVLEDWTRHAKTGSLKRDYDVKVLATYEPGEQVFFPEAGELYFYENVGTNARRRPAGMPAPASTSVVVGNARTKEVITSREMPGDLRGAVHTTVLSPDGRFIYIIGPSGQAPNPMGAPAMGAPAMGGEGMGMGMGSVLRTPATLLKVDALTLQPIKQLAIGGRLHHGQIFQDKYILMDTFISDPDGLDIFLFDPETDEIVGGINSADLGGSNYTAYTDNEFIYVLMQPGGDGGAIGGANGVAAGNLTVLRPYWVTKIDPTNWEVVAEYPYSGYRGDWIIIDSNSENIYIPASGSSNVTKVNTSTGAVEWATATGTGPYGGTLTADEKEIWISNKGEATGAIGRTLTVVDTASGRPMETVFSGYMSDHVLLAPNGKEMWVTSNGEGRIYVFDAATKEQLKVIDMPGRGDPHGLVWVNYDKDGNGKVVRDQGGFHNGVNPAEGKPLLD